MMWAPEHTQVLRSLAGRMSYSEIATELNRQFGTAYTRNACIGRAHRLGIQNEFERAKSAAPETEKPWEAAGKAKRTWYRHKQIAEGRMPAPMPRRRAPLSTISLETFRCAEVDPLHVDLVDLNHDQCRWPYGDGPYTFCGHPTLFGSYCGPHFALSVGSGTVSERAAHRVSERSAA